jgi:hypothetical protein
MASNGKAEKPPPERNLSLGAVATIVTKEEGVIDKNTRLTTDIGQQRVRWSRATSPARLIFLSPLGNGH